MKDINSSNEVICSNEDDEISANKKNSVVEHNFSLDDSDLMSAMKDINSSNEVICSNEDDEISGNKKNSVEEHNFSLDDSGEHRTVMYKSQGHLSISTLSQSKHNDNETSVDYVTAKGLLYPLVDEFIRLGPTCNDITWFDEQIELFKIKKIAERKDKNQDSTVYLSQHNGRKRVPRYKHPREK